MHIYGIQGDFMLIGGFEVASGIASVRQQSFSLEKDSLSGQQHCAPPPTDLKTRSQDVIPQWSSQLLRTTWGQLGDDLGMTWALLWQNLARLWHTLAHSGILWQHGATWCNMVRHGAT